jgi:hypothetical protein
MKNILIIEVEHRGHHFISYLKNIVKKLQSKNINCYLITTSEATKSIEFSSFKKSINKNIKIFTLSDKFNITRQGKLSILFFQLIIYFKIKYLIKELISKKNNFDLIYLNTLDHFEKIFCILGPFVKNIPIICILLNIKFHFQEIIYKRKPKITWIYTFLFRRLLRFKNIKKIIVLDELFIKYLRKKNFNYKKKISLLPEFGEIKKINNKKNLRENFKIPKKNKVMLIYGVINSVKGIKEAINSLLLHNQIQNLSIMIVGKYDIVIKNLLNNNKIKKLINCRKIIIIDYFVNEKIEREIFTVSDFGWAGYVYGSQSTSGFLIHACAAGLPIISNNKSLTSYHVRKNKLGICIDPFNYTNTNKAVKKFIYMNDYKKYVKNCYNFAKKRTKKKFLYQLLKEFNE